jgi:hypothetical protein
VALPGTTARKPMITMNSEGMLVIPSRNQWLLTMRGHVCCLLEMTKAIDFQAIKKLEKVKENLEKQFEFINSGFNYGHM